GRLGFCATRFFSAWRCPSCKENSPSPTSLERSKPTRRSHCRWPRKFQAERFTMATKLTTEDARQSLNAHVASKGLEIREKYGPRIGWAELQRILQDRSCVRYPCEIAFDATPLEPGEFAHPVAK